MTNPHAEKIRAFLKEQEELAVLATPGPYKNDDGNGEIESRHDQHYRISVCERPPNFGMESSWELSPEEVSVLKDPYNNMEYIAHLLNNAAKMRKLAEELLTELEECARDTATHDGMRSAKRVLEQAAKILGEK